MSSARSFGRLSDSQALSGLGEACVCQQKPGQVFAVQLLPLQRLWLLLRNFNGSFPM